MEKKIEIIAGKIEETGKKNIFTGAGISTESGIPDYRSKGGIWDKFKPIYFNEFMSSKDARVEYWKRKSELYTQISNAKPNKAHIALAEFYKAGLIDNVITQNIDGLHQKSGIAEKNVIELHGNTLRIKCMSCGKIHQTEETYTRVLKGDLAPECNCGGYLKPDTISFGQTMPMDKVEKATTEAKNSNFFLVVGSTLVVQPASLMPIYAKNNGAYLAIINLSETPCDNICDILINEKAGVVLSRIAVMLSKE